MEGQQPFYAAEPKEAEGGAVIPAPTEAERAQAQASRALAAALQETLARAQNHTSQQIQTLFASGAKGTRL